MSTNTDAAKSAIKAVGTALVVLVLIAFWFWPRERWENEWNGGDCLAWRVTDYGDLFSSVAGPYVVEDKWC